VLKAGIFHPRWRGIRARKRRQLHSPLYCTLISL
jgi:hypothetical protein